MTIRRPALNEHLSQILRDIGTLPTPQREAHSVRTHCQRSSHIRPTGQVGRRQEGPADDRRAYLELRRAREAQEAE